MRHILWLLPLLAVFSSCQNPESEGYSVSPTRVPYKFRYKAEGHPPAKGDVLMLDLIVMDKDSTLLPSPVMEGMPAAHVMNGAGLLSYRVDPIFSKATVGDSLTVKLPASIVYRLQAPPKGVAANEFLYCHLYIKSIESFNTYQKIEKELLEELRANRAAKNDSLIQQYLSQNAIEATKNDLGVYVAMTKTGDGVLPKAEDKLYFHYRVYLLDGTLVDESYKRGKPFDCIVGRGGIIEGLDRVFPSLPLGTEASLFIPSDLAYGEKRMGRSIPPNSNLRFDVKLLKIE